MKPMRKEKSFKTKKNRKIKGKLLKKLRKDIGLISMTSSNTLKSMIESLKRTVKELKTEALSPKIVVSGGFMSLTILDLWSKTDFKRKKLKNIIDLTTVMSSKIECLDIRVIFRINSSLKHPKKVNLPLINTPTQLKPSPVWQEDRKELNTWKWPKN